ncbi:MAG: hypothetical protein WBA97_37655 [Actinophytocola sp.]|uniref:hypothetical protein n=1 Tax=Actinophytocola sp. TaxID=1872138 RepID=UPI003C71226B
MTMIGSVLIAAAPAQATVGDAVCTGTSAQTYSPGLTNTAQTLNAATSTHYVPCTSLADPALNSGATIRSLPGITLSCTALFTATTAPTITWNTGQTSTLSLVGQGLVTVPLVSQSVTYLGSVTAGQFVGDAVALLVVYTGNPFNACSSTGVTAVAGLAALTIA